MGSPVLAPTKGSVDDVVGRIERMPMSTWHLKTRVVVGVATFFDGFDAISIAYVLPAVAPLWQLTPAQIGLLLSASFAGQVLALQLNLMFSNANNLAGLYVVDGPLAGSSVQDVLNLANKVLGGYALPSGLTFDNLSDIVTNINEDLDAGTIDRGYLLPYII